MAAASKGQAKAGVRRRFKLLLTVVSIGLAVSGYKLYGQMKQYDASSERLAATQAQLDQITKDTEALKLQIERLNDPEYIAQLATKEHGMVKVGEQQIIRR